MPFRRKQKVMVQHGSFLTARVKRRSTGENSPKGSFHPPPLGALPESPPEKRWATPVVAHTSYRRSPRRSMSFRYR